ncbi:MAG: hypothetical protein Alpg2KO_28350 [Alphaproteobacteria bacterium]
MDRFTLHVRLTKKCNADCSYCSSWQEAAISYMPPDKFARAIDYLADKVLPVMGLGIGPDGRKAGGHASIQYVGGEILLLPRRVLRENVLYARDRLAPLFDSVRDGVQSNLIAPENKVAFLHSLFGNSIGTSVDNFSGQRTIKGDPAKYREIFERNRQALRRRRGLNPSGIFVVDKIGLGNMQGEIEIAERDGYDLTLRPVFQGGSDIDTASVADLSGGLGEAFSRWALTSNISIQPFYKLFAQRVANLMRDEPAFLADAGCPFQKNCARVSLDLEPNGDLYICLDMADSDQYKLGNAVTGEFDTEIWSGLDRRREHFDQKCQQCTWLAECQGGCMSEAIHHTGSPYGRTDLCDVWVEIFQRSDALIEQHGLQHCRDWLNSLSQRKPVAAE